MTDVSRSKDNGAKRTVADGVVELLVAGGVTDCFGVAGSTTLPFLDAIYRDRRIRYHPARHEDTAVGMAGGYARVSNRLGFSIVHVGPGATNTLTAFMAASCDHIPVLLITGNEESWTLSRHPYHFWPGVQVFDHIARFSYRPERLSDIPVVLRQAVSKALRAVPGYETYP